MRPLASVASGGQGGDCRCLHSVPFQTVHDLAFHGSPFSWQWSNLIASGRREEEALYHTRQGGRGTRLEVETWTAAQEKYLAPCLQLWDWRQWENPCRPAEEEKGRGLERSGKG